MKEKLLKILNLKSEDIKKEDVEGLINDIKEVASSLLSITPNNDPQPESIDEIVDADEEEA